MELDNVETLKKVINCIQAIPDVYSVKRIQTSYSGGGHQNNARGGKQNKQGKSSKNQKRKTSN